MFTIILFIYILFNIVKALNINISNLHGFKLISNLEINNINNSFTFLIDTGSPYTWVPGYKIGNHKYMDNKTSKLLETNLKGQYSGGSNISFSLYKDDFYINNKIIKNTTFGLTTYESNDFINYDFDGIIGIGGFMDNEKNINKFIINMITYNMYKQNIINNNVFSLYINFTKYGEVNKHGGNLEFGNYNKSNRIIEWLDLIKNDELFCFWAINLTNIEIMNKTFNINNITITDSGTSDIIINEKLFKEINEYIGGTYNKKYNRYIIKNCNKLNNINLYIQNKIFTLKNIDYTFIYNNTCFSKIIYNTNGQNILGLPFLQRYYSIYDFENKRIGFSKNN